MVKEKIQGRNNYEITCLNNVSKDDKLIIIISHGLGSSKESPTVLALMKRLRSHQIGAFAFDFPGHGESPAKDEEFLIENCINDLETVEEYVNSLMPDAEKMYFSSSFGAYINLIYLAKYPSTKKRTFLRCAAIDMPGIFKREETPELVEELKSRGYFVLSEGCVRPLKITQKFCNELENNNIFTMYKPGTASIAMIHGDCDESAPLKDARAFAQQSGADLTIVKNGDHRLMGPGQQDFVLDTALSFFTAE